MAAADPLDTHVKEILTCSVCLEILTNPRTLQCLHSHCENKCLATLKTVKNNDVEGYECPICLVFTASSEVRRAHLVEQLIDAYKGTSGEQHVSKCQLCNDADSLWSCFDCKDMCFMCDNCKIWHDKIHFKNGVVHEVLALNECSNLNRAIDRPLYCSTHNRYNLELFCVDCDMLLCVLCKMSEHDGHKLVTVDEGLNLVRLKLKRNLDHLYLEADAHKRYIQEQQTTLGQRMNTYDSQIKQLVRQRDEEEQQLKMIISKEERELKGNDIVTSWIKATMFNTFGTRFLIEFQSSLREILNKKRAGLLDMHVHRNYNFEFPMTMYDFASKIDLEKGHSCNSVKISIAFNHLIVPNLSTSQLMTYSLDGLHKQVVKLGTNFPPHAVIGLNSQCTIAAAANGLFILGKQGQIVQQVDSGEYCDVVYRSSGSGPNLLAGLKNNPGQVKLFAESHIDVTQAMYKEEKTVPLYGYQEEGIPVPFQGQSNFHSQYKTTGHSYYNTLLMTDEHIFVAHKLAKCIVKYDLHGLVLQRYTGFESPSLCGLDSESNMLVCYSTSQQIHTRIAKLFNKTGTVEMIAHGSSHPIHAVLENRKVFWVLEMYGNDLALRKYKLRE